MSWLEGVIVCQANGASVRSEVMFDLERPYLTPMWHTDVWANHLVAVWGDGSSRAGKSNKWLVRGVSAVPLGMQPGIRRNPRGGDGW